MSVPVSVAADSLWLPKAGNSEGEYEDAFCIEHFPASDSILFQCAVADGATETSFSALWAAILVHSYCRGWRTGRDLKVELPKLQTDWQEQVGRKPLPWFAEQKALQGAFASLLGLTIRADGLWETLAVGDSCLFHVRGAEVLRAFPLENAAEFSSRPILLSSNTAANGVVAEHLACAVGSWVSGDSFYLMTDALAHWFLSRLEQGDSLRPLPPQVEAHEFAAWIADLRASGQLRNDDITLLRVDVT